MPLFLATVVAAIRLNVSTCRRFRRQRVGRWPLSSIWASERELQFLCDCLRIYVVEGWSWYYP